MLCLLYRGTCYVLWYTVHTGPEQLVETLLSICEEAAAAVQGQYGVTGSQIIVLSDKMAGPDRIPIPSIIALGTYDLLLYMYI